MARLAGGAVGSLSCYFVATAGLIVPALWRTPLPLFAGFGALFAYRLLTLQPESPDGDATKRNGRGR